MPRPQDYIITRPQLLAVITDMMTHKPAMGSEMLKANPGVTPAEIVNEIFRQRDLHDAGLIRQSHNVWDDKLIQEEKDNGITQADS